MQPLPIGLQTFADLISGHFLYVDKTQDIYRLVATPKAVYSLSRPRRFGKSLLVSTLAAIFEGRRELFETLWIGRHTDYKFEKYAVIQLDLSQDTFDRADRLETYLIYRTNQIAARFQIELTYPAYAGRFAELIEKIGQRQRVVILIDEYDKPILDNLQNPPVRDEIKEVLRGFYTSIKASDAYLRFVLLTGITKFAKISVFSGLNNLLDISMDDRYAETLGITQTELETYFADHIDRLAAAQNLDRATLLDKIRVWYNGYRFSLKETYVYNPFSVLLLFEQQHFKFHWFETGTPTFLLKLLKQSSVSLNRLYEDIKISERKFATYRLEKLEALPLLFQSGYLTIKAVHGDDYDRRYSLNYPNVEVKQAFLFSVLDAFSHLETGGEDYLFELVAGFKQGDVERVFEYLKLFFANIPYDLHLKHEKYYQTIFYTIFQLVGLRTGAEVKTNRGRIDAVVETEERLYIFEFKLFDTAQAALSQIKAQQHHQKYLSSGKRILLIGVAFDPAERNIGEWVIEAWPVEKKAARQTED